jgi:hypothetical protein
MIPWQRLLLAAAAALVVVATTTMSGSGVAAQACRCASTTPSPSGTPAPVDFTCAEAPTPESCGLPIAFGTTTCGDDAVAGEPCYFELTRAGVCGLSTCVPDDGGILQCVSAYDVAVPCTCCTGGGSTPAPPSTSTPPATPTPPAPSVQCCTYTSYHWANATLALPTQCPPLTTLLFEPSVTYGDVLREPPSDDNEMCYVAGAQVVATFYNLCAGACALPLVAEMLTTATQQIHACCVGGVQLLGTLSPPAQGACSSARAILMRAASVLAAYNAGSESVGPGACAGAGNEAAPWDNDDDDYDDDYTLQQIESQVSSEQQTENATLGLTIVTFLLVIFIGLALVFLYTRARLIPQKYSR